MRQIARYDLQLTLQLRAGPAERSALRARAAEGAEAQRTRGKRASPDPPARSSVGSHREEGKVH